MRVFDKIDGKKIDLSNKHHRDVVLQRNKELEQAVENGLEPNYGRDSKCKITVEITTEITCLKCGENIQNTKYKNYEDVVNDIDEFVPTVSCTECGTKYSYHPAEENFHVAIPKPKIPAPK